MIFTRHSAISHILDSIWDTFCQILLQYWCLKCATSIPQFVILKKVWSTSNSASVLRLLSIFFVLCNLYLWKVGKKKKKKTSRFRKLQIEIHKKYIWNYTILKHILYFFLLKIDNDHWKHIESKNTWYFHSMLPKCLFIVFSIRNLNSIPNLTQCGLRPPNLVQRVC